MAEKSESWESGQGLDDDFIRMINRFIEKNSDPEAAVTKYLLPKDIQNKMDLSLSKQGCSREELYQSLESYLNHCVRTGHRQYFNQLWSGFTLPGFLGDVITSLTNTSMYTYEVAPIATVMENVLIEKMGKIVGYKDPDGIFVTGGSNGNLIAMLMARNRKAPELASQGFQDHCRLKAYISDQAHYSFEKAASILGIGTHNIHKILSDDSGRMLPQKLEEAVKQHLANNELPFFIGATSGTTVKGAFDPLDEMAAIAKNFDLWLHVDGSFGGSVILSQKHRDLLKGCELADSYVWNPHKMMGAPLVCSVLLTRHNGLLHRTFKTSGTEYLFHDNDFAAYDLGPKSMQCGRRVDALKLWLSWKAYGDQGYAKRLDRFFDLAAFAEKWVISHPQLELMAPRSSVTVCFRGIPRSCLDINRFNLDLREQMARSGNGFVNYSYINEQVSLRLVILNHETEEKDIERFFKCVVETGDQLDEN